MIAQKGFGDNKNGFLVTNNSSTRLIAHPYFLIKIWMWWARNFRDLIESDDRESEKTRLAVFCGQKTLLRLTKAKKTGARPNGFIRAGSPVFLGSRFWSQIIPRRRSEFSRPRLAVFCGQKTLLRLTKAKKSKEVCSF